MTPNLLFTILNATALISWILMAALPGRRSIAQLTGVAVPAFFAVVYVAIIATTFAGADGGFSSLSEVAALFANRWLLLAGWTHYLAFDLLIGSWELRDARDRGIAHALVLPCLALTFLFGPAGWLSYLALRARAGRAPRPA